MRHGALTKVMCAGAAALAAGTATGAVAFAAGDSIALPKTATLVARGVAVDIPVRYTCQSSDGTSGVGIKLSIRENSHGWVAHGSYENYGMLTCDGAGHVIHVTATADNGGRAFVRGTAYVDYAALTANFAPTATASGVITLK